MKRSALSKLILIFAASFSLQNIFADLPYRQFTEEDIIRDAEELAKRSASTDPKDSVMASSSTIDWTKGTFSSKVSLDILKAEIPMPSGKATSLNRIKQELPILVKDPLLSLYVDDAHSLGDLVLESSITLEELTRIVDNSTQTPAVFANGGNNLLTEHSIRIQDIGSLMVKHRTPYIQQRPLKQVASRPYSGIIIDARGTLDVQGEFIKSKGYPCLFPKIWSENMDLIYERNMVDAEIAKAKGIVSYSDSDIYSKYTNIIGKDPLIITAKKIYGVNRCDPVIGTNDYLKITTIPQNLELLRQGKVMILLDKENLVHNVSAPEKNKNYYVAYHKMKRYYYENVVPDTLLLDGPSGIQITMQNLHFIPDSPELLPEELPRIAQIAESLKRVVSTGEFSILVEGHTADLNKPAGQMELSIKRSQTIINSLIDNGVPGNLFTYKGYGATKPVADNKTENGRAQNRRVEIIVMPKGSSVQRR